MDQMLDYLTDLVTSLNFWLKYVLVEKLKNNHFKQQCYVMIGSYKQWKPIPTVKLFGTFWPWVNGRTDDNIWMNTQVKVFKKCQVYYQITWYQFDTINGTMVAGTNWASLVGITLVIIGICTKMTMKMRE